MGPAVGCLVGDNEGLEVGRMVGRDVGRFVGTRVGRIALPSPTVENNSTEDSRTNHLERSIVRGIPLLRFCRLEGGIEIVLDLSETNN